MARLPILEVDFGKNGGRLTFFDVGEVQAFANRELAEWEWLQTGEPQTGQLQSVSRHVLDLLSAVVSAANRTAANQEDPEVLRQRLLNAFATFRVPLSSTPERKFIDQIREEHGPVAAVAALAQFANLVQHIGLHIREQSIGVVAAAAFQAGLNHQISSATKKSLDDLRRRFADALSTSAGRVAAQGEEFEEHGKRARRFLRRVTLRAARRERSYRQAKLVEMEAAIADIRRIQATYEEAMTLQAPVDYWMKKAAEHRRKAKKYRTKLIDHTKWIAPALVASLLLLAGLTVALATKDTPTPAFLAVVTLGVVLTTMAFWVVRILVRLFMSEHHLAIDAEERATMALTYLALTNQKAAEKEDRTLVLTALFRPTADGIVKDDAAPETPLSVVSKLAAK